MAQNSAFDFIAFQVAAFHHHHGHFNGLLGQKGGKTRSSTPTEARNEVPGKARSKNIGAHPDHGPSVEHGIDPTFAVVPHDQAAELKSRFGKTLGFVIP